MAQTVKPGMDGKQMRKMFMGKKPSEGKEEMGEKKPMIKPSRKGLLHKKLGVPEGKKIPASKVNKALKSKSPALRKEANFAKNFGK